MRNRAVWFVLLFVATGCAARTPGAGKPAWGDDSRSSLEARGTAIDLERSDEPPQAATSTTATEVVRSPAGELSVATGRSGNEVPSPAGAPVVRLLEAGAEPRQRVRYRLAGPKTEDLTMEMSTTVATAIGGGPVGPEVTTPSMRMIMSHAATPAGRGEIACTTRITDASVAPGAGAHGPVAERMAGELRKVVGLSMEYRMTARGEVGEVKTVVPPDAPASLRGTMESMLNGFGGTTVFPAEAIGVGARWETEKEVEQNGMTVQLRARYRLSELAGTRAVLDLQVELTAGAQEMKLSNSPGATAQLESMRGAGTGTLTMDLGSVVPRSSRMTVDSDVSMRVAVGDRPMAVATRMKMTVAMHAGR